MGVEKVSVVETEKKVARFGTYLGIRSRGFVTRVDVRVKERKESRIIHFLA